MNKIKENGFINDNYILTAIEAECYGRPEIFFIRAKRYDDSTPTILIVDFILAIENDYLQENKYEVCETRTPTLPFDIESVTEYAKDYLERNALEMYARLKRKLQAGKPSVSFSYYEEDYDYENIACEEDRICISIPRSILGDKLCDIIETFDGHTKIAFDKENDAVKIYHSIVYVNEGHRRYIIEGLKTDKTSVRSFLNLDEEPALYDKNFEEEAKQIQSFFDVFCDTKEEIPTDSEEDSVLV